MARRKRGYMATQALTEPTKLWSTTTTNTESERHEPRKLSQLGLLPAG